MNILTFTDLRVLLSNVDIPYSYEDSKQGQSGVLRLSGACDDPIAEDHASEVWVTGNDDCAYFAAHGNRGFRGEAITSTAQDLHRHYYKRNRLATHIINGFEPDSKQQKSLFRGIPVRLLARHSVADVGVLNCRVRVCATSSNLLKLINANCPTCGWSMAEMYKHFSAMTDSAYPERELIIHMNEQQLSTPDDFIVQQQGC